MSVMLKTYKVMLLPNKKQHGRLMATANAAKYAYNWAVALQMQTLTETGKYLSENDIRKRFTQHKTEQSWLYSTSNNATKQAIKDCCNAFWRFVKLKKQKGYKPYSKKYIAHAQRIGKTLTRYDMNGHPKFKKRKAFKPTFYADTSKIVITQTHVKLEGLAISKRKTRQVHNRVRLAEHGRIPTGDKYYNPRITFDGLHWWLAVGVEHTIVPCTPSTDGIGIDLGITEQAVRSDGVITPNINKTKQVRKIQKHQRRLQRSISRKYNMNKEGERYRKTRNIIKSERALLKLTQRLTNIRHNHIHMSTNAVIQRKPSHICVEDLNIRGMMQNKYLARSIAEQNWYEYRRQLRYKSLWHDIPYHEAPTFFASSKLCSRCGSKKRDLTLRHRVYNCEVCGLVIDRDLNAAYNLQQYGRTA